MYLFTQEYSKFINVSFFFQKALSNKVTQKLPLKTPKNILFCYSS